MIRTSFSKYDSEKKFLIWSNPRSEIFLGSISINLFARKIEHA